MNNYQTTIEFSAANYLGTEENQSLSNQLELTVTRSGNIENYNSVQVQLGETIAEKGVDFDGVFPQWLEFKPQETEKKVYLEIYDDLELEGTEDIELKLVADPLDTSLILGEQKTTIVSILDNETDTTIETFEVLTAAQTPNSSPTVEFGSTTYTVSENDGLSMLVTLNRSGDTSADSFARLEAMGGSATLGLDYGFNNVIYFAPGETSQSVEIFLGNDPQIEGTETIDLQLLSGQENDNYVIGTQNTTTVEILDGSPTVEFGSATYTMNEDEGLSMAVTLNRSGNTDFDSWVRLETIGGSATLGLDYGFNNMIHFAAGETSQVVEVFLANDGQTEGTETFELQLLSGQGDDNYVLGTQNTARVEITETTEVGDEVTETNTNRVIAEIGEVVNLNHNSQTIVLDHNFINPVVFAQPLSYNGADPSTIRITDITSNSFSVQLQETTLIRGKSHSGYHTTESFSFLVVEQGVWELSDGSILEVGNVRTDAITTSNWEAIDFHHDFTDTPVVLTQVQTDNDATFVRTRQNNATHNGFDVALEEEEAYKFSGHGSETIAWLALSPGQGDWDGNQFMAGNTGNQVTHNWHTLDFGNNFTNAPKFLGNIATFDGPDASGLRYQNLTNGNVQIMVEEDTSQDSETNHTTEDVNFLAIEAEGNLTGSADPLTGLVDAQTGTVNADVFELGNASKSFYDNYGSQDYLEISNFDAAQDTIQLHGETADYSLGSSPFESGDQGIFLKIDGMQDELVGIVKNTTTLDINSSNFAFV